MPFFSNLATYKSFRYELSTKSSHLVEAMQEKFRAGGTGYGEFKKLLFEALWERFSRFRKRRDEFSADPAILDSILADGAARARAVALPVMEKVRSATGFR